MTYVEYRYLSHCSSPTHKPVMCVLVIRMPYAQTYPTNKLRSIHTAVIQEATSKGHTLSVKKGIFVYRCHRPMRKGGVEIIHKKLQNLR